MRVLGVDPGRKRVGLALSDDADGRIALPLTTLERPPDDREAASKVRGLLGDVELVRVVVGLPLRLDGTEGEAARRARRFGDALAHALEVPVSYVDERLTSVQAERALGEAGVRGRARRRVVDQAAATLILQSWLDRQAHLEASEREPRGSGRGWDGGDAG